jgi:glycine oxidase
MPSQVNTLILGQGLAGTLLSFELSRRGKSLRVIDDGDPAAASRVAAGLISPVTGQRTALMWRAGELLEAASESYRALESLLGQKFFHPLPLLRLYQSEEQRRLFRARALEPAHAPWLGNEFEGGIEIKGCAWLDAAGLVAAWRAHLKAEGLLLEAKIDWDGLNFENQRTVACLGVRERAEGKFKNLKFQPTKGELLTVEAPADSSAIRYGAHFAIPLGGGRFRVGATYDRQDLSPEATPGARAALEASAKTILGGPLEVTAHQAGLRPNLLGHFPALGAHPEIPGLVVFNGMGSKGALWAPYCAKVLAGWMEGEGEIPKELDVGRFNLTPYSSTPPRCR